MILLLALVSCGENKSEPLVYAIIPAEESSLSKKQYGPLVEHLSDGLDREVELMLVADYTAVVEALKFGHADIARIGPTGYVLAVDEEDIPIEVFASGIKEATKSPSYKSIIITRADSNIYGLNGASFAYVDVGSTSGYWAPAAYILEEEIELGDIFFVGSHPAVIEAVRHSTVDAGAVADNRYTTALEEGVIAEGELRILWESDPMFGAPIVMQSSLDAQLKEDIRQVFLDTPRDVAEHCGTKEIGFGSVSDSDYDQTRKVIAAKEQLEK